MATAPATLRARESIVTGDDGDGVGGRCLCAVSTAVAVGTDGDGVVDIDEFLTAMERSEEE